MNVQLHPGRMRLKGPGGVATTEHEPRHTPWDDMRVEKQNINTSRPGPEGEVIARAAFDSVRKHFGLS